MRIDIGCAAQFGEESGEIVAARDRLVDHARAGEAQDHVVVKAGPDQRFVLPLHPVEKGAHRAFVAGEQIGVRHGVSSLGRAVLAARNTASNGLTQLH
ncbi:hypothetical protein [Novosphingobium sp. BL-52-GroH]|uniref:hypothetical protein n=1 Tax=Novosphingobium sp. BL-52-GroH TaxID=3349877 RepID=UPI00384ECAE7